MGFWHSFGTGAPGRGQGSIIERWIRRHDGLILSCPPGGKIAAAASQKALRSGGQDSRCALPAIAQRLIPSSYGYTMDQVYLLCRFPNGATVWLCVFPLWLSRLSISKRETKSRFPSQVNATSRWAVTGPKRGRSSNFVK